jgi:hypothetical protein
MLKADKAKPAKKVKNVLTSPSIIIIAHYL